MKPDRWKEIERLYEASISLPAGERARFLAGSGADEEACRKVESLLAQREHLPSFFERRGLDVVAEMIPRSRPGTLVGHTIDRYEVRAFVGAGGMGEVYRALDSKLHRDVALKVLPAEFSEDRERLRRSEREAQLLASLNHPNIAAIYDLEDADGIQCLVLEFVEGQTLAERLKSGPLPLAEALEISRQIAAALEAAHAQGIVHRDLKPGNVMIAAGGRVKVLDFGIAKMLEPRADSNARTNIESASAGIVLGTPSYMSPEQARGKPIDKRADIWAFGVVLYEMLTGRRPFDGENTSETLASVLKESPDWGRVPPQARRLLQQCLEKDPTKRLRDIGDALFLIEDVSTPVPQLSYKWPWGAAAVTVVVAIGILSLMYGRSVRPSENELKPLVHLDVDLGSDVTLNRTAGRTVIISPDGGRLVYVSRNRLFTRRLDLDHSQASELAGTTGAVLPFFSPDGRWIGFVADGRLKKISVEGGAVVDLGLIRDRPGSPTWAEDGKIIVSGVAGLGLIDENGGTVTALTELAQGERAHRWPQSLPGGKAVIFSVIRPSSDSTIDVVSIIDGRRKTLIRGSTFARYLATSATSGHLVYNNAGTLSAVAFDANRLETSGNSVQVLQDVAYNGDSGEASIDFSTTGTAVVLKGERIAVQTLAWMDASGRTSPVLSKSGPYFRPRLSPDGAKIAFEISDLSGTNIWLHDTQRDTTIPLTYGGANISTVWSLDSRFILFRTPAGIAWIRADGGTKPRLLTQTKNSVEQHWPWSFSRDGKHLAIMDLRLPSYGIGIVAIDYDASGLRAGNREIFLDTPADERHPTFSPDGGWMAYSSDERGPRQVFVRKFPDTGGYRQISETGGSHPEWSLNGRELFFRNENNQIMVAGYTIKNDSFMLDGKPRLWSDKRLADVPSLNYDLAPDGKRIIALLPAPVVEQGGQNHVTFLFNFFDEVRRRTSAQ